MSLEHSPGKLAYTIREFCGAVGIGVTKFYDEVNAGRITIKKCGKRSLVTAAEAERYVASLPEAA